MTTNSQNQIFESYVPQYDAVPQKWDEAREFLVEHLRKITQGVNVRVIGWYLDEELLSGKQMFPGITSANNQQFRTVLRKVVDCSPLAPGLNPFAHGILFDANFSLIHLWVSATDFGVPIAIPIPDGIPGNSVNMDATFINITVNNAYPRAFAVVEYIQEL